MPAPSTSNQQSNNHAIRKSQSLGGIQPSPKTRVKSRSNNASLSNQSTLASTLEEPDDLTPVATPLMGRKTPKAKLGKLFKWFKNNDNKESSTNHLNAKQEDHEIYAKLKKTQALKALERSIFSNGTSVSNIKPASSVDSVCSVGSTASFSYVPIKVGF